MESIHSYLSASTAVIFGAVCAGLYTSYLNHLSSKNDIIKDYLLDLDEIERLCAAYWLFDENTTGIHSSQEQIGHELRAKIEATSSYSDLSKKILEDRFEHFQSLDDELFMVATGGSFQTANAESSPETYSMIMSIITEMRKLLREKRNSMFWTR